MQAVRDYPRPPRLEAEPRRIRIILGGRQIANTTAALRVLETFHPPTYYLPPDAFASGTLVAIPGSSFCEWKGHAAYWTLTTPTETARNAGWSYPSPSAGFEAIAGYIAVYAAAMDECHVGPHLAQPQPGGFYGGWITPDLIGPFKGEPGTAGW